MTEKEIKDTLIKLEEIYVNHILELVDHTNELTRSDLQACIGAEIENIIRNARNVK